MMGGWETKFTLGNTHLIKIHVDNSFLFWLNLNARFAPHHDWLHQVKDFWHVSIPPLSNVL